MLFKFLKTPKISTLLNSAPKNVDDLAAPNIETAPFMSAPESSDDPTLLF